MFLAEMLAILIINVKLFLNNQSYPYGNLNLDFDKK